MARRQKETCRIQRTEKKASVMRLREQRAIANGMSLERQKRLRPFRGETLALIWGMFCGQSSLQMLVKSIPWKVAEQKYKREQMVRKDCLN